MPACQAAFLTQAFLWMFAGLLRHGRRRASPSRATSGCSTFAADNFFILFIAQLGLVVVDLRRRSTGSARRVALGLFFVYAASLGHHDRPDRLRPTRPTSVVTAFLSASAMFGAAAIYGAVTKRSLAASAGSCSWA